MSKPPAPRPVADRAVRCSCTSTSSCPSIGTLAVGEYKPQTLYCNQLRGVENPGSHSENAWYYQCAELANRWLVESVGAPMIRGNADQMCDNASRSSFDVRARGAAYTPVAGDLLVWGGGRMGHVGVVTSVSPSSITFASQNYGRNGLQYPVLTAPRTGGFFGSPLGDRQLHAKCIIHPKKLRATATPVPTMPSGPCAGVAPANDGAYCGASRQSGFAGGDEGTLYTCRGGKTTSVRCSGSCTLEPVGRADHCS
jgi:surface antigen